MRKFLLLLSSVLFATAAVRAHEHAPRVLSPHNADAYSMKSFARFHRWRDLTGDAKVYEIFRYLADKQTGLYPLGTPAREGDEVLSEYHAVRDPVKTINVHPIGNCLTLGPAMAGVMRGMGIGQTRAIVMPGYKHVAAEVFYAGQWHYLDLDLRAVFRQADGSLASMEQAQTNPLLWKGPNGPLFFPLDRLEEVQKVYRQEKVQYQHGPSTSGHTMDYILRRGETLTRWWKPQGGRWHHHTSYHRNQSLRSIIEKRPRGLKSKHPSFTIHTHGNGRFVYRPNLTRASVDFDDGVYATANVSPVNTGLTLNEPGEGYAIFEVRTPYIIVPRVGELETTKDDRGASVVKMEANGVSVSLSLDNGISWQNLANQQGKTLDLTRYVGGTYGYLLKLALKGQPEEAAVQSLEIITWVQVHPASLPSLRKGTNKMVYVTGDHYGLPSHVMEIRPKGYDRQDFNKYLHEPPSDFDPTRKMRRAIGPFVASITPPPNTRIAWFSAGGNFRAHGTETRNSLAYKTDDATDFTTYYKANVPKYHDSWHYNADVEVALKAPARTVDIRYVGTPGVNNIRIYAHHVRDVPCKSSPVVITHGWREMGRLKKKTVHLQKPGAYEIVIASEPEDEYVEISVPGGTS